MNTKSLFTILLTITILGIISSGCKKTIINNYYCECDADSCEVKEPCTDLNADWVGIYGSPTAELTKIPDNAFISNGIAKLIPANSPYPSLYWTAVELDIP